MTTDDLFSHIMPADTMYPRSMPITPRFHNRPTIHSACPRCKKSRSFLAGETPLCGRCALAAADELAALQEEREALLIGWAAYVEGKDADTQRRYQVVQKAREDAEMLVTHAQDEPPANREAAKRAAATARAAVTARELATLKRRDTLALLLLEERRVMEALSVNIERQQQIERQVRYAD